MDVCTESPRADYAVSVRACGLFGAAMTALTICAVVVVLLIFAACLTGSGDDWMMR